MKRKSWISRFSRFSFVFLWDNAKVTRVTRVTPVTQVSKVSKVNWTVQSGSVQFSWSKGNTYKLHTCIEHALNMLWTCFEHALNMLWTCFEHASHMLQTHITPMKIRLSTLVHACWIISSHHNSSQLITWCLPKGTNLTYMMNAISTNLHSPYISVRRRSGKENR